MNWYDNIDDLTIEEMKTNWYSRGVLQIINPSLVEAIELADIRDLRELNYDSSEWFRIRSEDWPLYKSNIYRLRGDWERPERKAVEEGKPGTCGECRFWERRAVGAGFCRRWPKTMPKDESEWCGEYEG